jgi:hypothetical protein
VVRTVTGAPGTAGAGITGTWVMEEVEVGAGTVGDEEAMSWVIGSVFGATHEGRTGRWKCRGLQE